MSLVSVCPAPTFFEIAGAEFDRARRAVDEALALPAFGDALRLISLTEIESERMPWMVRCALLSRLRDLAGMRA